MDEDGNSAPLAGGPGTLKPLSVPPKRRSNSNGTQLAGIEDGTGARSRSTDAKNHRRTRSQHRAAGTEEAEVILSASSRVSPSSPVHRTGYDSRPGDAVERGRRPTSIDVNRRLEPESPRLHSHGIEANPGLPQETSGFGRFISRFALLGRSTSIKVQPTSYLAPNGPESAAIRTPKTTYPLMTDSKVDDSGGYDWKDSLADGKESKPTSPAQIMIQQKKRCGTFTVSKMLGLSVVLLGESRMSLFGRTPRILPILSQPSSSFSSSSLYPQSFSLSESRTP